MAPLLAMAKEERREEHRQRLRAVTEELDRIWEHLRASARNGTATDATWTPRTSFCALWRIFSPP